MFLKPGLKVNYDNGVIKGEGTVQACVSTGEPFIGKTYVLKDLSGNIPNDTYPYDCFACCACHIKHDSPEMFSISEHEEISK